MPRSKLHYAWVVAAATFALLLFTSSTRGVFSLLIDPLMTEFGWSRAATSLPASTNILVFGLMGPFAASLMARFGLRRVVGAALLMIAAGSASATQAREPWHLVVAWGIVCGIGMGCLATVLASTVANTWFYEKRGQVTGLLMAATTAGTLLFTELNTRLIEWYSWRSASIAISGAMLACIPLVALLIRNRPEDKGLRAYGAPVGYESAPRAPGAVGLAFRTLGDIRGSGMFWILFGSFWVCGVTTSGMVQTHWFEAAADHRFAKTTAAHLLVMIGACDLVGAMFSGWLCDRVDPRKLLCAYYFLRGVSLLFMEQVLRSGPRSVTLFVVIGFYGLDWVATVPPTIALANDLFGRQRGSVVYGWVYTAHQLGGALAAWFAAATRDWTGSFQFAYVVGGVLCVIAAVGVLGIGHTRHEWVVAPFGEHSPASV